MQSSNQEFKRKLLRLILFTVVIISILIVALLFFQKTVEQHYTTQQEKTSESINLYKSPDEEYRFIEQVSNLSSIHTTMIPNDLIEQ
jgi:uncharacterized protein YpmB